MVDSKKLYDAILNGNAKESVTVTKESIAAGTEPQELISTYMIPAMDEVGKRFENGEYFVPELLLSARAMKASLELINPLLAKSGIEPAGRVVIGTVKGDLHDIGKNLVASMLEGGGFKVTDLGTDVSAEKFADAVNSHKPDIVAMSALLTTTMPGMKTAIEALEKTGIRGNVRIMIGGAPVTQQFADEIGADGYSPSAGNAVSIARQLIEKRI